MLCLADWFLQFELSILASGMLYSSLLSGSASLLCWWGYKGRNCAVRRLSSACSRTKCRSGQRIAHRHHSFTKYFLPQLFRWIRRKSKVSTQTNTYNKYYCKWAVNSPARPKRNSQSYSSQVQCRCAIHYPLWHFWVCAFLWRTTKKVFRYFKSGIAAETKVSYCSLDHLAIYSTYIAG